MKPRSFAPVALFAYRRTKHLAQALDALEACPEFPDSPIFVFSDGPRNSAAESDVLAVRALLKARCRPNMTIVEAPCNRGLAASIIGGVTDLCAKFGRVIVIEDDLLVSPCTLAWFNAGLEQYEGNPSVWQVSAHQFSVPQFKLRKEGVLLHLSTSWGWATWERSWENFDPDATGWEQLRTDRGLRGQFNVEDSYPYSDLLLQQMTGKVDSWAIRWWWSMFRSGAFALFPPRSLVSNIGMDETATHSAFGRLKGLFVSSPAVTHELICPAVPDEVAPVAANDADVYKAIRRMWWATRLRARFRGKR